MTCCDVSETSLQVISHFLLTFKISVSFHVFKQLIFHTLPFCKVIAEPSSFLVSLISYADI